ncbi:MAG: hypothetical protein CMJ25_12155 [Phycisphaerae bacterium]|nr:hypothetical protein [Phycisphaerae bacterium]
MVVGFRLLSGDRMVNLFRGIRGALDMSENDVLNDYSHWHDRTGPYETLKELEYTHICDGCHEIVDSVDTDTGLCDNCTYEDQMNKFYKYSPDEWGTEL